MTVCGLAAVALLEVSVVAAVAFAAIVLVNAMLLTSFHQWEA